MMNDTTGVIPRWYQQRTVRSVNSGYKCWRWAELMDYCILDMSGERWEQQQAYCAFQFWTEAVSISQNLKQFITCVLGIFSKHLSLKVPAWKKKSVNLCQDFLLPLWYGLLTSGGQAGRWLATSLPVFHQFAGWCFSSWLCGGEESPGCCRISGFSPMWNGTSPVPGFEL